MESAPLNRNRRTSRHPGVCGLTPYSLSGSVSFCRLLFAAMILAGLAGCKGRTIKVDNPVFSDAPPRRSLVNQSADVEEQRLAMLQPGSQSDIRPVGFSRDTKSPLKGTSVIAEVNGRPVFVDDVLGGTRQMIEGKPELTDEQKQMLIRRSLQQRLPKYLEDELVIHALERKIPSEKRKAIRESLEPQFQKNLQFIRDRDGFVTDQQLNERLAAEGTTINQLRELFLRIQMVEGYLATTVKVPDIVDREQLVRYYRDHIDEFTPTHEVRFAEIVVRFRDHGGRDGAEEVMTRVVEQLQQGRDFGDVAFELSDTLSGKKRGEIGWIQKGSLADSRLEEMLFSMPADTVSRVQVKEDRFEVYKLIAHRNPGPPPFQEVQRDIEQKLLNEMKEEARAKIRQELREKGTVVTIFGDGFEGLISS